MDVIKTTILQVMKKIAATFESVAFHMFLVQTKMFYETPSIKILQAD
jgi:hypothetical protein